MKKGLRNTLIVLAAALVALALGMDLSPARPARPDATDLFGYVYQLIARTFASFQMDRIAFAAVFIIALWLCRRYLFSRDGKKSSGECLLSIFLGTMMLLCTAVRESETVAVLWANLFQLPKAAICLLGMILFFLLLLRALRDGLLWLQKNPTTPWMEKLDQKASFWHLYAVIAVAWLPHILARYPGVLMWDSYMQIKQFMGETERWANHPPFGTWLYGTVATLGETLGNKNLVYFIFTLLQCAICIAVLVYSLQVMKRLKSPAWLRLTTLMVYALSPCYVGWQTVIAKDSSYVVLYLLLMVLLLEFLFENKAVFDVKHLGLFFFTSMFLALCRHNGAAAVSAALAAVVLVCFRKERKKTIAVILCGALGLMAAHGVETIIVNTLQIRSRYIPDVLSYPFQQTARVVSLHEEEIPAQEAEILDSVLDYANLADHYEVDYADSVKDSYRQEAGINDRKAYWHVWGKQMLRYPVEYLDAALHMNGVLFDLRDNEPMYICFSDMSLYDDVYKWSFNDMSMYESEALIPLNSINRAFAEWYMNFDRIPLIGWLGSMSFHSIGLIALIYVCWNTDRRKAVCWYAPNLLSLVICLFVPVVYLRYALPFVCAMPMSIAVFFADRTNCE